MSANAFSTDKQLVFTVLLEVDISLTDFLKTIMNLTVPLCLSLGFVLPYLLVRSPFDLRYCQTLQTGIVKTP